MKQFMCQCGCGQTGEVSKWWKPSKGMPRYLPRHALRVHNRTNQQKYTAAQNPIQVTYSSELTPEQITYIKAHYKILPRSELAQRVGIDKLRLNFICIELGIHMRDGA